MPALAAVDWLDMPVTARVDDTFRAAQLMREAGVAAIIVLGGDGTHRAVVRECGAVPIAGLSTGTNNAFPEMREPTIAGLAAGLYAAGRIPADDALQRNKRLDIDDPRRAKATCAATSRSSMPSSRTSTTSARGRSGRSTRSPPSTCPTPIRRRSGCRRSRACWNRSAAMNRAASPSSSPRPARANSTCARRSRRASCARCRSPSWQRLARWRAATRAAARRHRRARRRTRNGLRRQRRSHRHPARRRLQQHRRGRVHALRGTCRA